MASIDGKTFKPKAHKVVWSKHLYSYLIRCPTYNEANGTCGIRSIQDAKSLFGQGINLLIIKLEPFFLKGLKRTTSMASTVTQMERKRRGDRKF